MADRGIKFAKDGKTISSTNPDDYNFWTKYPPLTYLKTESETIVATDTNYSGTEVIAHGYDFIPFVLVFIMRSGGSRYFMPATNFVDIGCDRLGLNQDLYFTYKVDDTNVTITWNALCYLGDYQEGPSFNQTFIVDIYYYAWELGESFDP
jgi:hypothetical protein